MTDPHRRPAVERRGGPIDIDRTTSGPEDPQSRHVVVIGGGIAGLSAAWALCRPQLARHPDARAIKTRVTVLEADQVLGGKIRTTPFADLVVDAGPDAFLARAPWATQLCHELGLTDQLVAPAEHRAFTWSRGNLHRFPERTVLGVPSRLSAVARTKIVTPAGLARAGLDFAFPGFVGRLGDDPSIGQIIGQRLGDEMLQRLVAPLLGSINAGPVENLSLMSTAPQLAEIASRRHSLLSGVAEHLRRQTPEDQARPVFNTTLGGLGVVVERLTERLVAAGVDIRTSTPVSTVLPVGPGRWTVEADGLPLAADAVLFATPATETARLLGMACPEAGPPLQSIAYASVSIVRLAYTTASVPDHLAGSGFVVPPADERLLTACSWTSMKWAHLRKAGQVVLRASVGRLGDERAEQLADRELIDAVHDELRQALGVHRRPFVADVVRWPRSFPQYEPGHAGRVMRIERAVKGRPGLAVAGAAYRGLGIPSCIRSGQEAAEYLFGHLAATSMQ